MKTVKTLKTVPAKVASKVTAKNGNGKTVKTAAVDATTAKVEKDAAEKSKERKVTLDDVKAALAYLSLMPSYSTAKEVLAIAHEIKDVE